jgi:hypothetical protein
MGYNRLWKQRSREDDGKRCYNNGDTKHEFAVQCSKLNKGMIYAGEKWGGETNTRPPVKTQNFQEEEEDEENKIKRGI